MGNIYRIARKELGGYITTPSAYIFLIIFLVMGSALFFYLSQFFRGNRADMGGFFVFIPWLFLFFIPAVAMRVWAEEKRSGTDELLMTMPVKDYEAVVGKYLAALVLLLVALVLTFPIPVAVNQLADVKTPVDWGPICGGYLGALLLGASILAIGTWASSLTINQIIAFILGCSITFAFFLVGFPFIVGILPFGEVISELSLYSHFINMYSGAVYAKDVVYYLSMIAFFLYLNVRSVESRKWK